MDELRGPQLRSQIKQAYKVILDCFWGAECCLCHRQPTVLFLLRDREGKIFMTFEVCVDCIKFYNLVPEGDQP